MVWKFCDEEEKLKCGRIQSRNLDIIPRHNQTSNKILASGFLHRLLGSFSLSNYVFQLYDALMRIIIKKFFICRRLPRTRRFMISWKDSSPHPEIWYHDECDDVGAGEWKSFRFSLFRQFFLWRDESQLNVWFHVWGWFKANEARWWKSWKLFAGIKFSSERMLLWPTSLNLPSAHILSHPAASKHFCHRAPMCHIYLMGFWGRWTYRNAFHWCRIDDVSVKI